MIAVDVVARVESSIARFLSGGARGIGPVRDTMFVTKEYMNIKYDVKSSAALRSTPKYSLVHSRIQYFRKVLFRTSGSWPSRDTAP